MTTLTLNGRLGRKSLSDQLDRLDGILDTLGEGLQEAVADAVKDAVRDAVQLAVTEVLTNPEVRRRLHPVSEPQILPLLDKVRAVPLWLASVAQLACGKAAAAFHRSWGGTRSRLAVACCHAVGNVRGFWTRTLLTAKLAKRMGKPLAVATGVGATVGLGCYWAGPVVAAAVSGLAGFAGALTLAAFKVLRHALTAAPQRA